MVNSSKKIAKRQWIIAIGSCLTFVVLLIAGMWVSDPNKGKPGLLETARQERAEVRKDYKARSVDAVTPEEHWISKSERDLTAYKMHNRELEQKLLTMQKKIDDIQRTVLSGNRAQGSPVGSLPPLPGPKQPGVTVGPPGIAVVRPGPPGISEQIVNNNLPATPQNKNSTPGGSSIQVFEFDDETAGAEKKQARNISHALPAGSFGKLVLLSGVDAPTGGEAASNPVPILMRLLDHGTLPNYFNSEIKDCLVTGAVRGDLASERGKIRSERLSCVLINGDIIDVPIKGWINGEDGKEGFRGRVVEKAGALLARTFVAGIFSGISTSVAAQYQNISQSPLGTVTSIDPNDVSKAGLASGLSTSMERLADYYMDRADEMYPIIEISANRIGELVLQEGVDLERNISGNMGGDQ